MSLYSAAGATLIAGALWLLGAGIGSITTQEPAGMRVVHLKYEDGVFIQRHQVYGTDAIVGKWSAEIMRGNRQLCSGGGVAPYKSGEKAFPPDQWTGGTCGEIEKGDIARAVWEFTDHAGSMQRISAEIQIR